MTMPIRPTTLCCAAKYCQRMKRVATLVMQNVELLFHSNPTKSLGANDYISQHNLLSKCT